MGSVDEFNLIEAVHIRPEVWDSNCVQFRSRDRKTKAWQSIAGEVGSDVESCVSTWKKLRDRYTRTKRNMPSGSEGGRRTWDKEEYMRFLDKVLITRKTTSNVHRDKATIDNSEDYEMQEIAPDESQGQLLVDVAELESAEFIVEGPSSSSTNSTTHSVLFTPDMEIARDSNMFDTPVTKTVKKRKRALDKHENDDVAATLITAINKLTKDETPNEAVDSLLLAFIKYHGEQVRSLLEGKTVAQQRRIRNRLTAFVDELCEEFV